MRIRFVAMALFALTGCGSYKKDLQTICDAPSKANVPDDVVLADRAAVMAAWIEPKLGTGEGKAFFGRIPSVPIAERGKLLRAEASKQGVASCGLADFYDAASAVK